MVAEKKKGGANDKGWKRNLIEWAGTLLAGVLILYIFAPESWWQFGVSPVEHRKPSATVSLSEFESGRKWELAGYQGKVVVLNYWATWCGPCRFETPGLVNIANEFSTHDVIVAGVTMDDDLSLVRSFADEYSIRYPILLPGSDSNLGSDGVALPTTFLYDQKGRLAKKYTGIVLESTLRSDISALLQEGTLSE